MKLFMVIQLAFQYELQPSYPKWLLLRVAAEAPVPYFEPIELLVPPLSPPDTAAAA